MPYPIVRIAGSLYRTTRRVRGRTEGGSDAMLSAMSSREPIGYPAGARTHFSPLTETNADNVRQLGLALSLDLPGERTLEAPPLAVDEVLYFFGSTARPTRSIPGEWEAMVGDDAARGIDVAAKDDIYRSVAELSRTARA